MNKNLLIKTLAVGIILLLLGVTVAQGISLNSKQLSLTKNNPNINSNEKVRLSCCYFTADGIIPVIREVTVEDANFLSQLMNGSDIDAIVTELNRLNLISDKIGIEKAKELVSGRYGQKISQESQNINRSMDTDWKENYNCNITGEGVDSYFMPVSMYNLINSLKLIYNIITLPIVVPLYLLLILAFQTDNMNLFAITILLMTGVILPMVLLERYLTYGRPIKATPDKIVANLFDAQNNEKPYLNTTGDNGTWGFEEKYRGIAMYMQGFYGIWLTIQDGAHAPGAQVKGYCNYIKAKGMSDWPWDGWEDDGWPW